MYLSMLFILPGQNLKTKKKMGFASDHSVAKLNFDLFEKVVSYILYVYYESH